jgi:hypothetical protein
MRCVLCHRSPLDDWQVVLVRQPATRGVSAWLCTACGATVTGSATQTLVRMPPPARED